MTQAAPDAPPPPWYLVLQDWHRSPHLGLDGMAWPLDDAEEVAIALAASMQPLPVAPGGCLFEGCFDLDVARAYFEVAAARVDGAYLIAVTPLDAPAGPFDGFDVGRPNGGFSVIGQEICKTEEGARRFGGLVSPDGLFPTEEAQRAYLADRAARFDAGGLEHLDESIAVRVAILGRSRASR